ncbi:MAG: RhuM family protein [Prevotella sp.]|uniref:RhuM family protein n=1 Tax=Prevotella sp. TaxID=59823 RepID=UPI002A2F26C6|nr:RhuM family protein [Prevotella sp.]MDD7317257.1 RhuM family protein [Prevotellaceae bacterium]MDY4019861.1 RhuM family protein [Prevotella sp.]
MENSMEHIGEMVIFRNEDGEVNVQIDAVNETIWATQKSLAELFGVDVRTISYHLKEIFKSGELVEDSVFQKNWITANDGKNYLTSMYNLDAIIAVGYRVNSKRATQFRIWATKVLRDYMVRGYVLDSNRFIKGQSLTYFKELLSRIRAIRISEKFFYQQIKDIYRLSIDYDGDDQRTKDFFATIQNKLLWAVSGQTAAELMYYRSNAALPQMGLTSTETEGKVKAKDIGIGKNYLNKEEIENLKYIVDQYLSFAEAQAYNHIPMRMADWETNLNIILTMNRKEILTTKGKIAMELAKKTVHNRYMEYKEKEKANEKLESLKELDRDIKAIKNKKD